MKQTGEHTREGQGSFFERYPRLTGVILLLLVIMILDLLTGRILIGEDYQSFRVRDTYYHHGIEPNCASITNWGQKYYRFYSNSLGFRDGSRRNVPLTSDNRRILFMGDSHTEAVGIDYRESFVGRLERLLENEDIEVLNGSAVSYSPRIHYLKTKYLLEEEGLDFDEIFVVIDMSDLNNEIAYENFEPKKETGIIKTARKIAGKISDHSAIVYLTDRIIKNRRNRFFYKHMAITERSDFELYATFFNEFKDADLLNDPDFHYVSRWLEDDKFREIARYSLERGRENIEKLHELCSSRGIEMTITVHPWQDQIMKGDTTNLFVESWRSFATQHHIDFINLYPVFINHTNPVLTASQCYIKYDNHWNGNGHKLVAEELLLHILNDRNR